MRVLILSLLALGMSGCLPAPYDPLPTSVYQWERRQTEITRREAERVRLCQMMNKDSERYERDCRRSGDPS
ncbi:hypothetical protein [Brevundimonas aurifodinae]|uniref:Lipoprotein n=2 Tax=Brevundimonas TaxID=41275 RepID=A0ABV1NQ29_9CAUL|nr:MAG: hypothetical protein B7Z42_10470 [Brevundimonas sp. 12-68-7]OYX32982.1 MAG: hypothetical protein B7Z01_10135 [Brevundimonas subvibrioides]